MRLGYDLRLEQTQKLIMTPELKQAIQLLQFNSMELNEYIKDEIQDNPLLELESYSQDQGEIKELSKDKDMDWKEYAEKFDDISYKQERDKNESQYNYESFVSYHPTLKEYLEGQLNLIKLTEEEYLIGNYIIENIDENGYLPIKLEEIATLLKVSEPKVKNTLKIIQGLDPLGVGARSLKECLLIQIADREDENIVAKKIIENYLDDLASNKIIKLSKELDVAVEDIQEACDFIKRLEPKPGRNFNNNFDNVKYIVPDATIKLVDGEFVIMVNDITGPRLNINNFYKNLLSSSQDKAATEFLSERLNSAMWIIRSIEQRRQTIYNVVESILKFQIEFFKSGDKALIPLTLKEVAEDIKMHESTISRATNGKYVQTPRGLYELKYFFTTGLSGQSGDVSSTSVKLIIKDLIEKENPQKPYSDQKISNMLKEKGTNISRRTVAKYRDELDIPSSSLRRKFS